MKKKFFTPLITTVLFLTINSFLYPQYPGWTVYTTQNSGIGGDTTLAIFLDNSNNLWFGTVNGAAEFDGINWTTYNSSNSPFTNYVFVNDIEQIVDTMYFSFPLGVYKFFNDTWELISINQPTVLKKDQSNILWIGTNGDGLYKYAGNSLTVYNTSNSPLRSNHITDLEVDSQNHLWITMKDNQLYGNIAGIAEFDGNNWNIYYNQNSGLINENIHAVAIDNEGNFWFGADSLYLYKYDGLNWSYINIEQGSSNWVTSLDVDSSNNIWIGCPDYSYSKGLYKYDGATFTNYRTDNSGLPNDWVEVVKVDNNNNKWIGTWNGLAKLNDTPIVSVLTPNGGESIQSLTTYNITWTYQFVNQINIDLTTNGGASWSTVANNISTISNNYSWNVPVVAPPSDQCKIKITGIDPPGVIDESDGFFTIFAKVSNLNFNPAPGTYGTPQLVTISTQTDSVDIYYTLDGSEPTQSSIYYTEPVNIDSSLMLKARAYRNNWVPSDVKSGYYTISDQVINILINAEPIWYDSDFNGTESRTVDGSGTIISYGNITLFEWFIDGNIVAMGSTPVIQLNSGTKYLTLRATSNLGIVEQDSVEISVYAASVGTNGPITSAVGQLSGNIFFATSADDRIYRFDSTGSVNWTILTGGDIQSTTCISNQNNIYVGSSDTRLYAFDSEGTPKWDRAMGGVIVSSPSISNDSMVYVGVSTGRLFAVTESGSIQWNFQTGGAINSSPSVSVNGDVLVGSDDGKLYSVSKDGNLNWSFTTVAPIQSSPAIGNDSTIVFGSNDGSIYKLNHLGGLVWSYDAGGAVKSSPVIDNNGQIYFGSENGKIFCLTSDGNLDWEYNAGGSIVGSPALAPDGSVIVGNNNGKLLVISGNGEELWYLQTQAAVQSPVLYTDNDLVIFGQNSGNIYIIKYPASGKLLPGSLSAAEWPTFKGCNKRTGNKLELITEANIISPLPVEYSVLQNYPNPFNPSTKIKYSIPKASNVVIKVFDILGNDVETLVNEEKPVGTYELTWYAENLPSGVYFYQLRAGGFIQTKKMLLLK